MTTSKTLAHSTALLDAITQAAYDNDDCLLDKDAGTDAIIALFNNPYFIEDVYQHVLSMPGDVLFIAEAEKDAQFAEAITTFSRLFGLDVDEYSICISAHRPPFIEFSSTAEEFEGGVSLTTWRDHKGGHNGTLTMAPTPLLLENWLGDQGVFGIAMHGSYKRSLEKDALDIAQAYAAALFTALDLATTAT